MREIKFRAWNIPNNCMYYNVENGVLATNEKDQLVIGVSLGKLSKDAGTVLMQFTGREDADINGQEVYESDIIENCDTKDLQVVYWNDDKCAWHCKYLYDEKRIVSLADSLGNLNKKIGNIYENPELLKPL